MFNSYQLEQHIQQAIQAKHYVGLALAIVQGTAITYARGFGVTSVEDGGLPVTPQTLFCFGSISKNVTATLVMRLVEQGKLDLDVPVTTYLPNFRFSDPGLGQAITLRHVLSHTTGLPAAGKDFGPRDPDALRRFVWEEIPLYDFIAPPGTVHLYNNTVFVLAGYLAEVVTGRYYDQLVQELIFDPLQMHRSTFDRTVAMTYPLALAHEQGQDGTLRTRHRFTDNVSGNPAGFGIGSTLDLANFALMHLNNGQFQGSRILSAESVMRMQTPHANRYIAGAQAGYGLGWFTRTYKGVRQVAHGGMIDSYNCFLTVFPEREVAMVLQTNYDDGADIVNLVESIYDQLLDLPAIHAGVEPIAPDRSLWPGCVGTYLSGDSGFAGIAIVDDQLSLERGGDRVPLTAVADGLYQAGRTSVGFVPQAAGPTEYLVINAEPYRRFERDPLFVPDPAAWANYPGIYQEWDGDTDPIRIRAADGQLFICWSGEEAVATPLSNTSFISALGLIEFEVAETGIAPVLVIARAARRRRVGEHRTRNELDSQNPA